MKVSFHIISAHHSPSADLIHIFSNRQLHLLIWFPQTIKDYFKLAKSYQHNHKTTELSGEQEYQKRITTWQDFTHYKVTYLLHILCRFLSQTATFFKRKKKPASDPESANLVLCKRINKNIPCQQESAHMVPSWEPPWTVLPNVIWNRTITPFNVRI